MVTKPGKLAMTPRAKRVIELALREADEMQSSPVSTEHILLALMRETEGIAFQVLDEMGLSEKHVRRIIGSGQTND